jgi:cytoskeletal protein CcmA (bactofilin family)
VLLILLFAATGILTAQTFADDAGSIYMSFTEEKDFLLENNEFKGDYVSGRENIVFSGLADDLYLFSKSVDFKGSSTGALSAFAENIDISGIVGNNLHSMGKSVRITGHILETAFIGAQDIVIAEGAVLDGTLISGSSTLHIIGNLKNGLVAGAGEIIIDGPVSGDVRVKTGNLIITERGSISGNLTYSSNVEISSKEESRVNGIVKYELKKELEKKDFSTFIIVISIIFILTLMISGLLILLLPGVKLLYKRNRENASYGKTLLWGLIPLFIYPVVLLVTIPLFPLSIALGLSLFPFLGLTTILGLALAGQLLFKLLKWEKDNIYLQFLLAFAVFIFLTLIPFVKVIFMLAVAALGSGLLISKLFNTEF